MWLTSFQTRILALLVIRISVLPSLTYGQCVLCKEAGRQARNAPVGCPSKIGDCGQCIPGYEYNASEECTKIEISYSSDLMAMSGTEIMAVQLDDNFTLHCLLSEPNDCAWLRDEYHVLVGGRYSYTDVVRNGLQTKDCSLNITKLQKSDLTNWQCAVMADANQQGKLSGILRLTELKSLVYGPKSRNVSLGDNIIMRCEWNTEVDCFWMRDGYHLDVKDRYRYINGSVSSNCSIEITNVQPVDEAQWQCGHMANAQEPGSASPNAVIHFKNFKTQPANASVTPMENVTLPCVLNKVVNCFWLRNGHQIKIDERYTYLDNRNGTNTDNCSIEIANVQKFDIGTWQCGKMAGQNDQGFSSDIAVLTVITNDPEAPQYTDSHERPDSTLALQIEGTTPKANTTIQRAFTIMTAHFGSNIILGCIFNQKGKCTWTRNQAVIKKQNRFRYIEDENEKKFLNCTISIASVTFEDEGLWECGYDDTTIPSELGPQYKVIIIPESSSVSITIIIAIAGIVVIALIGGGIAAAFIVYKKRHRHQYSVTNQDEKAAFTTPHELGIPKHNGRFN